jgi:GTPase
MQHFAGYVNIIGKPNAGKSTLLNQLMGEKLAIVTAKAQTTRHRILAIFNDDQYQIIFSDTPGVMDPKYKLQERMMHAVESSLDDGDVYLFVADAADPELLMPNGVLFEKIQQKLAQKQLPAIFVLNKLDLISQEQLQALAKVIGERFPDIPIHPISAQTGFGVPELFNRLKEYMPEHPPYFDKEDVSDRPVRFFLAEMIREKILLHYEREIPYSVQTDIETYEDGPQLVRIRGIIYVNKPTHKNIIIGHKGAAIKRVGTEARLDMEAFLGKKVFLELYVKVVDNWRNDDRQLNQMGYI